MKIGECLGVDINDPRDDLDDDVQFKMIDSAFVLLRGCNAEGGSQWGYAISQDFPRDALIGQLTMILDRMRQREIRNWLDEGGTI